MKSIIFSLILVYATLVFCEDSLKLYSAFVLVNQGSSTPVMPLPTMDWSDWPEKGPQELTASGMREQYLLGHELFRRYNESGLYFPNHLIDQVMFRAIDHNNTVESAMAFIRGFLGDLNDKLTKEQLQKAEPPINVQEYFIKAIGNQVLPFGSGTLPYHTHYPHEEDIFAPCSCKIANHMIHENFMKHNDYVNRTREQYEAKFLALIKSKFNIPENLMEFPHYLPILDSLSTIILQYGESYLTVPEKDFVMEFANALSFSYKSGVKLSNKYRAIPILSFINKFFNSTFINSDSDSKLNTAFIFTEERIITSFLSYIGYNVSSILEPSSIVRLEIYSKDPNKLQETGIVKLFLNDIQMKFSECKYQDCEYNEFKNYVNSQEEFLKEIQEKCKEMPKTE